MSTKAAQGSLKESQKKPPAKSSTEKETQDEPASMPSAWSPQTNAKQTTPTMQSIETRDLQAARHFSTLIRQQLDPAQKEAAKKRAKSKDPADRLVLDMLQAARQDVKGMVKLIEIARHDAFVQIQEQRENIKYYKKFKKTKLDESFIDPEFGCTETLPEGRRHHDLRQ